MHKGQFFRGHYFAHVSFLSLGAILVILWHPPSSANCIEEAKTHCHVNGSKPIEWHCGSFYEPPWFPSAQAAVDHYASNKADTFGRDYHPEEAYPGCAASARCVVPFTAKPREYEGTLEHYLRWQCGERKYFAVASIDDDIDPGKECYDKCASGSSRTGDGISVGNPVLIASGEKVERTIDYKSPNSWGVTFQRYYSSGAFADSPLGSGWRHNFMRSIVDVYSRVPPTHEPDNAAHSALYDTPEEACTAGWNQIKGEFEDVESSNTTVQWAFDSNAELGGTCAVLFKGAKRGSIQIYDNVNSGPTFTPRLIAKRVTLGSGRVLTFNNTPNGWLSDPDIAAELVSTVNGLELHTPEDTVETFDPNNRLVSIEDRAGRTTSLTYDSGQLRTITDPFGRTLTLSYNAEGQLISLDDPAELSTSFQYDMSGLLVSVVSPDTTPQTSQDNPKVTIHYEDNRHPNAITGITDELGQRFATWSYNDDGRAVHSEHGGGVDVREVSAVSDREVVVTDGLGMQTMYTFEILHGTRRVKTVNRTACDTCPVDTQSFTYDTNGFIASRADFNGRTTEYMRNSRGLEIKRTEAVGTADEQTVTTQWHPDFRLPVQIDQPGRRTKYTYDGSGNRLTETITDTATGESRMTTWTYNTNSQITSSDGPRTDVSDITTYDYDAQGNLDTITNALGHVTQITEHDPHGNPLRIVDPNGIETVLTYDARQRLTLRSIDGATTQFLYDSVGQLTQVTLPGGATLSYEYDTAHRLVAIENHNGNRIDYTLDTMGNHTAREIRDIGGTLHYAQQQVFDQLSRLKEVLGNNGQSTQYDYDATGNRTAITEAGLYSTLRQFDALDRLTKNTDAANGETVFQYDALDNLVSVTDPEGLTTSYTQNAFGDLVELESPDTGVTRYTYDNAGNRISETDARGITATYSYDALSRLTLANYPGTDVDTVYHYDGNNHDTSQPNAIGRLSGTEKSGAVLAYFYDARGNLIRQTTQMVGNAYETAYTYDVSDNVTEMVYPSGRTIAYQRDAMGRVTTVTATHDGETVTLADQITYLPFGGVESLVLGNGQSVTVSHDLDYRLTDKQVPGLMNLQWIYDPRDNVTAITDAAGQIASQQFAYDTLSRLDQAQGSYGTIDYTYDGVGNRLTRSVDGATETYAYAADSNRLQSVTDGSSSTAYTYDAAGNMLTKGGGERQYSYDASGRLTEVNEAGTNAYLGSMRYNAHGQRFHASLVQENYREIYHYNQQGRLITEMDHAGNPVLREYVYLEDMPLVMFARRQTTSGDSGLGGLLGEMLNPTTSQILPMEVFYFHTDHLGMPRLLTDSSRAIVWQGQYRPFGNVTVITEDAVNPLRFPGQRDDGASGVYYNYFRDYSPELGRYIQSDPIGLAGGINTYGYTNQNPLIFIDPYGLEVLVGQHPAFVNSPRNRFNHAAIVLRPDRPQDFVNHPLFTDSDGTEATLGGQAFGDGLGLFGRLQSAFNYPGDDPGNLQALNIICAPEGQSDSEFINNLINIAEAYNNEALYDPFPDPWGFTFNSNSYVSGLLRAAGATPPDLPGTAPGYRRPLPFNDFRN